MRARTLIIIAGILGMTACSSGDEAPQGPALPQAQAKEMAATPTLNLPDERLTVVKHAGDTWFVTLGNDKPKVDLDQAVSTFKAAVQAVAAPRSSSYTTELTDPQIADVNPLDFTVSPRQQPRHYVLITDSQQVLQGMNDNTVHDQASGLGGTYTAVDTHTLTILRLSAPDGLDDQYLVKATAVEMCQAAIEATPTDATVDRAFANAQQGGGGFTRDDIAGKVAVLAQEAYCNSFGLASAEHQDGLSYQEYFNANNQGTILVPGTPKLIMFPEPIYQLFS